MTFLWPEGLVMLALVPVMVGLYVVILRQRKNAALPYSNFALVKEALGKRAGFRRHVPPLLLLGALILMLLALARPATTITLPSQHETVILAIDVSGSMRADDVKPTRLAAAQAAARAFVNDLPSTTRIGVVSFAGSAALIQPPTRNHEEALAAIERLQLENATAVGSGILVSLKAIFPDQDFDGRAQQLRAALGGNAGSAAAGGSHPIGAQEKPEPKPVPPGSYKSAVVILLTDGQTTTGPDPVDAARLAAARGVRVFTVGVGTPDGQILTGEGWSIRVRLDEDALKVIADMTRAEYFFAGNAPDLKRIYQGLNSKLVMERKQTEVTALFTAVAASFTLLAAALSLMWFNRIL